MYHDETSQFISQYLSFLSTCRQIHAEAHLLPFALTTIQIHPEALAAFLGVLADNQRAVITTVKISENVESRRRAAWLYWPFVIRENKQQGLNDPFHNWRWLQELSTLPRLRRVLVGSGYRLELADPEKLDKEMLITKIKEYAGKPDVEVEFVDPPSAGDGDPYV